MNLIMNLNMTVQVTKSDQGRRRKPLKRLLAVVILAKAKTKVKVAADDKIKI